MLQPIPKFTNDIAFTSDFEVVNYQPFEYYFQFKDADANPIFYDTAEELYLEVFDRNERIILKFTVGDGLSFDQLDASKILFKKVSNEKNYAPGTYFYRLMVKFPNEKLYCFQNGSYVIIKM